MEVRRIAHNGGAHYLTALEKHGLIAGIPANPKARLYTYGNKSFGELFAQG